MIHLILELLERLKTIVQLGKQWLTYRLYSYTGCVQDTLHVGVRDVHLVGASLRSTQIYLPYLTST